MGTKIIKAILTFKVFIFLLIYSFLISPFFAQNNPNDYEIIIEFDDNITEILKKGEEKTLNQANKIKGMWEEIIRTKLLPDYFNNLKLDENDPRRLPSCIIEAMNAFLSNKKIEFTFAIPHPHDSDIFTATDESSGAVKSGTGRLGKIDKKDDKKDDIEDGKIIIYKLYQDMYYKTKEDWEADREKHEKGYCTASVLFHEMMHKALEQASKDKDLKEKFCFKIEGTKEIDCFDPKTGEKYKYDAKRCTNKENMYDDEGIAEDCEMKAFSCGESSYKDYYNKNKNDKEKFKKFVKLYKPSGARAFNPDDEKNPSAADDCSKELCKEGNEECDDNCAKKEDCPQKPPDHQDDNFSFSSGSEVNEYRLAPEALIYKGGFYHEAVNLFGGLLWDGDNSAEELLKASKVLIIPSGGLYSHENDSTLKNIMEEYVRRGGSLILLCQQYGIACGPIGICEQKRKKSNFFC